MSNTFEHRHYKAIAAIIARIGDEEDRAEQARYFAEELRGTNPAYNYDRFLAAALGTPSNGRDRT